MGAELLKTKDEQKKKRIGVIFGGRSGEHEVSILSAASVIEAIDKSRFKIVPVGINKLGQWFLIKADLSDLTSLSDSRIKKIIPEESLKCSETEQTLPLGKYPLAEPINVAEFAAMVDFAFPVLHGPYGEDGTIQGLFEMLSIPYAGPGVTCSALAMDKIFTKEIWIRSGLPVCAHRWLTVKSYYEHIDSSIRLVEELGYPVFVKPANMGSSVGVSRAADRKQLKAALNLAFLFDRRVIIEEEVIGRELEIALLGGDSPEAGAIGEIVTDAQYYDYEAKYTEGRSQVIIPAEADVAIRSKIEELSLEAFTALDGHGFSRIDFFITDDGRVLLNEMNTIPGFTKFSMFPLLMMEKGYTYVQLIERIIELGYERYHAKN
ncbi:MAG: D-alanine--D-alanine ligase [Clostridiales Family XIII bacterium]|nr:D-alanine--D-alanine ligase [Clostridiales Family XIII bacterium]